MIIIYNIKLLLLFINNYFIINICYNLLVKTNLLNKN